MSETTAKPTAEEIQRIAEICGEISLGACGLRSYRATFPGHGDRPLEVVAVPPEKVEGIFEAIWLRLREHPDYSPLRAEQGRSQRMASEAALLRETLREWVEADRDLRAHPPNDTTKRWERKLQRVEVARAAAEAMVADV